VAELLEITLKMEMNGQICINRWNYIQTGTPSAVTPSFGLTSAFGGIPTAGAFPAGSVTDAIHDIVAGIVQFDNVVCLNPYDDTDFYANPFVPVVVGGGGGVALSPTSAFGFLSSQTRRDIRHGTKRFVGVQESDQFAGGGIEEGTLSLMVTLADKMSDVLSYDDDGNTLTYTPCIVKKEKYTVPGSDPARFAYRYLDTGDPAADKVAQLALTATSITWQPYDHTRTQTSRQYGRGI